MLTILLSTHTTTIIQHKLLAYHNHILNTIISLGRKSCWTYCWALGYPYINMRSIMTMADEIKNKKPKEWKKKIIELNSMSCFVCYFFLHTNLHFVMYIELSCCIATCCFTTQRTTCQIWNMHSFSFIFVDLFSNAFYNRAREMSGRLLMLVVEF